MNKSDLLMASYPDLKYQFDKKMPKGLKGHCAGNVIRLNPKQHVKELPGTLGEEIGHYLTGVGDITAQDTPEKRKQEQKARDFGVLLVVTPADILECYKSGLITYWECADYLGITVKTLKQAIDTYSKKNDGKLKYNHYTFYFNPNGTVEVIDWFK